MKKFLILLIGFLPAFLLAQADSFVDIRDGQVYKSVKIEGLLWFVDNLKCRTENSFCPNFNKRELDCKNGNFYYYNELYHLCPQGWRIPNEMEWNAYFEHRLLLQNGIKTDVEIDTLPGLFPGVNYTDAGRNVALFAQPNSLYLQGYGWAEGATIKNRQTSTLWIKYSTSDDNRFHLHIANHNYIMHSHGHNLEGSSKKARKFMVKCVCDDLKGS